MVAIVFFFPWLLSEVVVVEAGILVGVVVEAVAVDPVGAVVEVVEILAEAVEVVAEAGMVAVGIAGILVVVESWAYLVVPTVPDCDP